MAKVDENYIERLFNSVAKAVMEAFENLTIEDVDMYKIGYNNAIEEYSAKVYEELLLFDLKHGYPTIRDCQTILSEIAESMKGEKE